MRKRSAYRPKPISRPMLVNRGLLADVEITEVAVVEAYAGGWATTEHFDYLADMRDCMMLAAAHKNDASALAICRAMLIVMDNIRLRYAETKRFGATGDELQTMRVFVDAYRDFWLRQPVGLYESAVDNLDKLRREGKMVVNVGKQGH